MKKREIIYICDHCGVIAREETEFGFGFYFKTLPNIYKSRKNHKLDEWSFGFIEWILSLPYSELITGGTING